MTTRPPRAAPRMALARPCTLPEDSIDDVGLDGGDRVGVAGVERRVAPSSRAIARACRAGRRPRSRAPRRAQHRDRRARRSDRRRSPGRACPPRRRPGRPRARPPRPVRRGPPCAGRVRRAAAAASATAGCASGRKPRRCAGTVRRYPGRCSRARGSVDRPGIASTRRRRGSPGARRPACRPPARCRRRLPRDRADDLVAEHHRRPQDRLACRAVRPVVQVGSADAAVGDLDHGLVGRGCGTGSVDAQVIRGVGDDGEDLAWARTITGFYGGRTICSVDHDLDEVTGRQARCSAPPS